MAKKTAAVTSPNVAAELGAPLAASIDVNPLDAIDRAKLEAICVAAGVPLEALKAGQLSSFDWRKVVIAALATPAPGGMLSKASAIDKATDLVEHMQGGAVIPAHAAALDHFKAGLEWLKR